MNCLLCGSNQSRPYYSRGAPNNIPVFNRVCENCGLVFQYPRQSTQDLREFYADYMQKTHPENNLGNDPGNENAATLPQHFIEQILALARLRMAFLKPFLREGMRVLDIGASFGALLKVLRDESGVALSVLGVNPEKKLVDFAKEKFQVSILQGMAEDMKFEAGSFDLVILDNVIEHLENPKQVLEKIHHWLSESGIFFVVTNNLDRLHGFPWQNFLKEHTVTYSPQTLKMQLESCGFKITTRDLQGHTTCEGYRYPYQMVLSQKNPHGNGIYDFKANGENAQVKINELKNYDRNFFNEGGVSKKFQKKLYAWEGVATNGVLKTGVKVLKILAAPVTLGKPYRPPNHTLPPEVLHTRRVWVGEIESDRSASDQDLFWKLFNTTQLTTHYILLIRQDHLDGKPYELRAYDPGLFASLKVKIPKHFPTRGAFYRWLGEYGPRIDELVALRLNQADLHPEAILETFDRFQKSKKSYALCDFRQYTPARWEFLKRDRYSALNFTESDANLENNLIKVSGDRSELILWPRERSVRYYYQDQFKKYYSYPRVISLDLNPACNLTCGKCQFHAEDSPFAALIRREKKMPFDLVEKLANEMRDWPVKPQISPTFSGEVLMYPELEKAFRLFKEVGCPVVMFSNGNTLSEKVAKFFVDLPVDTLNISLDSFKDETYPLLQGPGKLSVVKRNLLRLLEIRGNRKQPRIGVHMVYEKRNVAEWEDYLNFWVGKVDYVSRAIKQDQQTGCQPVLPTFNALGGREACFTAWEQIYVRWNGDISYCAFDIKGKLSGLNVRDKTLLEVWNSPEFWKWREAQITRDYDLLYCKACPDWAGPRNTQVKEKGLVVQRSPFTETYSQIRPS